MSHTNFKKIVAGLLLFASGLLAQIPDTIVVKPRLSTAPVITDADDPAVWTDPTDPSKSLVIGTDKGTYPDGGIYVWNLDGSLQQRLNISRPNNIDVRYGLRLAGQAVDIAAVTMRDHRQVRIFKIDATTRTLSDITTLDSMNVLNKMFKSPYGLALYKRQTDGAIFVIVSSRDKESWDKLWQIRLEGDGTGHVKGTLVREFGAFRNVVEGMLADDELGYLYAPEEKVGIHKYYADPHKGNTRLALFSTEDSLAGNYEGIAVYKCADSTGYLLVSRSSLGCIKVYRREGEKDNPHQHLLVTTIRDANGEVGEGIEVASQPNGPTFPHGFLVWQDQKTRNYRLYAWEDIAQKYLKICESPLSVDGDSYGTAVSDENLTLQQNYPNPFNPDTEIHFVLKRAGLVRLTIYNVLGEEVRSLFNTVLSPGSHVVHWDAKDNASAPVPSGIYFYQIRAGSFSETRRMILSR